MEGSAIITARRVAIIGAGIGGLAAAIDLAVRGIEVTILERAAAPGGKVRQVMVAGQPIDAGPTMLTMRWVFESLFAHASESLSDHLVLRPATTLARHAWAGQHSLDLFADRARSADAIGTFAGAAEAKGYLSFCKEAGRIYETLEQPFIAKERPSIAGLVAAIGLVRALRLKQYDPYMTELGRYFKNPRLRQMFGNYTTHCGTSPYQAPATLMLMAHIGQEGVWLVEGGMQCLVAAMATVAEKHGATIRSDTAVAEIMVASGRANGVRLSDGEVIHADAVVMNGEPTALATGLLGRAAVDSVPSAQKFPQRSLSATTWAMTAQTLGMPLLRNNVFFSADYPLEFKLIQNGLLPTEPTISIYAQDRPDHEATSPTGPEQLLLLVNAPPSGDRRAFSQVEVDQCMQGISGLLDRCGVQLQPTGQPVLTTPAQFHRLFPASGGALYGAAVLPGSSSFRRPGARTRLGGMYLAGGSTHPGGGVPFAALSGRFAAASILHDMAPAPPSRV